MNDISKSIVNAIVNIRSNINSLNDNYCSKGFIYDIIDERAIIITCAHSILLNDIYCTMTNIIDTNLQKHEKRIIPLSILGKDVNSDIAVLFSHKENENGFNFDKSNNTIKFGENIEKNTTLYLIDKNGENNNYHFGKCHNSNIIFDTDNINNKNYMPQILVFIQSKKGLSGSPLLYIKDNSILVAGLASFNIYEHFVAGPNINTLKNSYEKILSLNNIESITIPYNSINFTNIGYLGITSFCYINNLPEYEGYKITNIDIDNSKIYDAIEINNKYIGIEVNDIIIQVNDKNVKEYNINFDAYYNISKEVILKIFRPSINKTLIFKVIPSIWPKENISLSKNTNYIVNIQQIPIYSAAYLNVNTYENYYFTDVIDFIEPKWTNVGYTVSYNNNGGSFRYINGESTSGSLNYYYGLVIASNYNSYYNTYDKLYFLDFYSSDSQGQVVYANSSTNNYTSFFYLFLQEAINQGTAVVIKGINVVPGTLNLSFINIVSTNTNTNQYWVCPVTNIRDVTSSNYKTYNFKREGRSGLTSKQTISAITLYPSLTL